MNNVPSGLLLLPSDVWGLLCAHISVLEMRSLMLTCRQLRRLIDPRYRAAGGPYFTRDGKRAVSLFLLGHVDAGKSTLLGHLHYLMGGISAAVLEKTRKKMRDLGKGSQVYAALLPDGRANDNFVRVQMSSQKRLYNFYDAPGFRDFNATFIRQVRASLQICSLVVVSAALGEFEAGYALTGLTRDHILLGCELGIRNFVLAISKLDDRSVQWQRSRYTEITEELQSFMKRLSSRYPQMTYEMVPISAWTGDNVISLSSQMPWYDGPTLLEVLDRMPLPLPPSAASLRIAITRVKKQFDSKSGKIMWSASARVLSGALSHNANLRMLPENCIVRCAAIYSTFEELRHAYPCGKEIDLLLEVPQEAAAIPEEHRNKNRALVLPDDTSPLVAVNSFTAEVRVFFPMKLGSIWRVNCAGMEESCRVTELLEKRDPLRPSTPISLLPEVVKSGEIVLARFETMAPMLVEPFTTLTGAAFSRIVLREGPHLIALGNVTAVSKEGPGS